MPNATSPQKRTQQWDNDLADLEQVTRFHRSLEREYSDDPAWQKDIAFVLRVKGKYSLKVSLVEQAKQAFEQALALSSKIRDTEGVASAQDFLLSLPPSPTQADSLPTQADSLPTQADSLPTQADSLPTQADSLPTQADSLPTQADSLPTQADSLPTQAQVPSKPPSLRARLSAPPRRKSRPPRSHKVGLFAPQEILDPAVAADIWLGRGPPSFS